MDADDLTPKDELPLTHVVVVNVVRAGVAVPVTAFEFRQDGHLTMRGADGAGAAWPLLVRSTQKALAHLSAVHMAAALQSNPELPCNQ